jgi:hypothetical protein
MSHEIESALRMNETERPSTAFLLSLIAGILILLGGAVRSMIGLFWFGPMIDDFRGWGGMMGYGYGYGFPRYGYGVGVGFIGILGLIFGVVVIFSAIRLKQKPQQHTSWGTLIVILSVLSIFSAMAGFGIGLVLGLIGGILAVTWKGRTEGAGNVESSFVKGGGSA